MESLLRRMICFLLIIVLLTPAYTLAQAQETMETPEDSGNSAIAGEIKSALLVEMSTQQPLAQKEADILQPVAGLCKLPALLVVCEAVDQGLMDLSAQVSVSSRAAGIGGPSAFIERGETIEAAHLMKAAAMICAGDAIEALGEAIFGTETAFLDRINNRLDQLGVGVTLNDPIGIGTNFSSRMLAVIGAALMQSECFTTHSTLTLEKFTHQDGRETELVSANKMLRNYAGCIGVATGSSPSDGYCGVFSVARGDTKLICVVLGAKNSNERFAVAQALLDEAYATLRTQSLAQKGDVFAQDVRVKGGKISSISLVAKDTVVLLLDKAEPALTAVENIPEELSAPLKATDVVGSISYQSADGVERGKVELVPAQSVEKNYYRDCIREVLLIFLRI
ncbi:hypothetical protein LJC42_01990 [Eubacteriales bacterium OttesenSCG-928-K08]|nr:hypothetical protein [Eubacteriales bacterium OttesenSCG-928-K08]